MYGDADAYAYLGVASRNYINAHIAMAFHDWRVCLCMYQTDNIV